jgi:ResB-like family.
MAQKKRGLWEFPWQYRESGIFITGFVCVGIVLQLVAGHFNFYLLHTPVNLYVLAALLGLVAMGVLCKNTPVVRWISGIPFSVCLIGWLLVFSLIMGLTPQTVRIDPHAHSLFVDLGFTQVTSSWPFVLLFTLTLVSLGITTARRLMRFRKSDLAFCCNHLGLWVLMLASGLGAADMQRYTMHVREGEVEWRVYDAAGKVLELPVAIRLKDFIMEEYPPKLAIINRESGIPQPEGKPWSLQIDPKRPAGQMGDWRIAMDEYVHEAVRMGDGYKHSPMPASTPAVKVTATNTQTNETRTGWVCGGGNIPGFFAALTLDDKLSLVMTLPEPKRFASDITVLTRDGKRSEAMLEVNKPVSLGGWAGGWMVYQYGYDTQAGKMSTYSSMELIHDAWLYPAYAGIILMCLGSLILILTGTGKRRAAS